MTTPLPRRVIPQCAAPAVGLESTAVSSWHHIADVFPTPVWDEANRAKDRQDEALDAMRISNGMTLDQFLESSR